MEQRAALFELARQLYDLIRMSDEKPGLTALASTALEIKPLIDAHDHDLGTDLLAYANLKRDGSSQAVTYETRVFEAMRTLFELAEKQ